MWHVKLNTGVFHFYACMHAAFSEFILPSYEKPLKYVPRTVSRYRDMKHVLRSLFQRFVKQFPDTFNFLFFFFVFFLIWWWWFCFYLTLSSDNKYCVWVMACTCIYCDRGKIMNRWHIIKEIFVFYLPFYWVQI